MLRSTQSASSTVALTFHQEEASLTGSWTAVLTVNRGFCVRAFDPFKCHPYLLISLRSLLNPGLAAAEGGSEADNKDKLSRLELVQLSCISPPQLCDFLIEHCTSGIYLFPLCY